MRILIATAVYRNLPYILQHGCLAQAHRTILTDTDHQFGLWMDFRDWSPKPNENYYERTCGVVNNALATVKLEDWDFVLWTDADVVEYPPDICSRLLSQNPTGISAPLPLVEGTNRLYDTLGSVIKGGGTIKPNSRGVIRGRNLANEYPYWPRDEVPETRFVEMDCVGMQLLVPAWIFAKVGVPEHEHQVFAGWYAACKLARESGLKVGIDRYTTSYHASLPKYGLSYH